MMKTMMLAAGLAIAIPGLALAQSPTSSTPGQTGSRSMMQGDAGASARTGMDMSTGSSRKMTRSHKTMKHSRKRMHRAM
ncbi:hypothetical protein ABEG18_13910 [Alsobacter sp. KACC 23698]|uniref:Pentapeptide MXKDX repeat protein n=1 Tax=Alsobacter sp. KACC 23698 TaxID=3149229 RepID=A0AAU7J9D8_9HYPH